MSRHRITDLADKEQGFIMQALPYGRQFVSISGHSRADNLDFAHFLSLGRNVRVLCSEYQETDQFEKSQFDIIQNMQELKDYVDSIEDMTRVVLIVEENLTSQEWFAHHPNPLIRIFLPGSHTFNLIFIVNPRIFRENKLGIRAMVSAWFVTPSSIVSASERKSVWSNHFGMFKTDKEFYEECVSILHPNVFFGSYTGSTSGFLMYAPSSVDVPIVKQPELTLSGKTRKEKLMEVKRTLDQAQKILQSLLEANDN